MSQVHRLLSSKYMFHTGWVTLSHLAWLHLDALDVEGFPITVTLKGPNWDEHYNCMRLLSLSSQRCQNAAYRGENPAVELRDEGEGSLVEIMFQEVKCQETVKQSSKPSERYTFGKSNWKNFLKLETYLKIGRMFRTDTPSTKLKPPGPHWHLERP